jgi:AcrR family transcriptional regulator
VPKRVDHEERRRQIADALLRTAATRGLHATGMREVAAEAGVSLRLVQYYFGTKEELMLFAMQQLAAQFAARAMAQISKIKQAQDPVSPRDVITAILAQALPADDERRTFTILNAAYFALSLTEPALAIGPLVKNSNAVIDVVASQLRAAQAAGDTPAGLDPDLEALSLPAMSAGLGTSILGGQSSPGQAQAVIDYHLDRLFPAPRPALPPAPSRLAARGRHRAGLPPNSSGPEKNRQRPPVHIQGNRHQTSAGAAPRSTCSAHLG